MLHRVELINGAQIERERKFKYTDLDLSFIYSETMIQATFTQKRNSHPINVQVQSPVSSMKRPVKVL